MYEGRPGEGAEFTIGSERKAGQAGLMLCGRRRLIAEHLRESRNSEPAKVRYETSHTARGGRPGSALHFLPRQRTTRARRAAARGVRSRGIATKWNTVQPSGRCVANSISAAKQVITGTACSFETHRAERLAQRGASRPRTPRDI